MYVKICDNGRHETILSYGEEGYDWMVFFGYLFAYIFWIENIAVNISVWRWE